MTQANDSPLLVQSSFLTSFPAVTRALGLDPHRLVVSAKLDPACLERSDMKISWGKVTALIEMAAAEAKASDFGLRLAAARGLPDIGPLLLLLREEPNLHAALLSLQSYIHLHSRTLSLRLEENGDFPILRANLALEAASQAAPQIAEFALCSVVQMLRWLIGKNWAPEVVCFSHSGPCDRSMHNKTFGCPVEFDHAGDSIVFSRTDLQRPISNSSPLLRHHAELYIRGLEIGNEMTFQQKVMDLVAAMLPSGRCSSTRVARHLNMDRTTLNRHLMAETGESYFSIQQNVRKRLAEKFCSLDWPFVDVADQLGFSSVSVFSRWFKENYGITPSTWRNKKRRLG